MCGKQTASKNMPSHIEANHITGISHSCNICGKTSRSRDALRKHKHTYHDDVDDDYNYDDDDDDKGTPKTRYEIKRMLDVQGTWVRSDFSFSGNSQNILNWMK